MKAITSFSTVALGVAAALALSIVSSAALADGMPFESKKTPILTPLDQALEDIQNQEPPVEIAEPEPEPAPLPEPQPEPKIEADLPPPVPNSRVVEVQPNTSFFGLSVGMYDPLTHGEQAASFNIEYQPGVKIAGILQPLFGALATTDGSLYGYGGIGVPFKVSKRIFLMPSVAVGAYKEGGGVDLDRTLAFRVGTELAYQFDNKSRLGLNIHAITNGTSFDRDDRTEVISLVYTTPTTIFSGRARKPDVGVDQSGTAPVPTSFRSDLNN